MAEGITIYGATGRLGRLVTAELVAQGAHVRLAGRDARKLAAFAAEIGPGTEWKAAPIDNAAALADLVSGSRVVVNGAGSLSRVGERLIDASLDAGIHYIDATGEQPHVRDVFERYGEAAERKGVALVPAFGFEYALGDCLARIVACDHQPAREVVVAYAIEGPEVRGHSLQFAAERPGGGEVFYEAGRWTPARSNVYRQTVDFPAPFGRQAMTRYGSGEIVTVPRHTQTDAVTSLITIRALVPHPLLIPVFPYMRPVVALMRRTPARHLLGLALWLRRPSPSASDVIAQTRRFAVAVHVHGRGGSLCRGVVEGGDFLRVTAATLAFGARRLASPTFDERGALAPALAVDPEALLDDLQRLGVTWRVEHSDTTPRTP